MLCKTVPKVIIILILDESTHSESVESSSAIEPVTEVLKDVNLISPTESSQKIEDENTFDESGDAIGITTRDSDDESISISLPSNGEESNKDKVNSFLNATSDETKLDQNDFVRNSLKKQILRILSTDDEDDEMNESPLKNQTERIKKGERLVAIIIYFY